jgi:hypothetical protein
MTAAGRAFKEVQRGFEAMLARQQQAADLRAERVHGVELTAEELKAEQERLKAEMYERRARKNTT